MGMLSMLYCRGCNEYVVLGKGALWWWDDKQTQESVFDFLMKHNDSHGSVCKLRWEEEVDEHEELLHRQFLEYRTEFQIPDDAVDFGLLDKSEYVRVDDIYDSDGVALNVKVPMGYEITS